jgi:hypothetical protein
MGAVDGCDHGHVHWCTISVAHLRCCSAAVSLCDIALSLPPVRFPPLQVSAFCQRSCCAQCLPQCHVQAVLRYWLGCRWAVVCLPHLT